MADPIFIILCPYIVKTINITSVWRKPDSVLFSLSLSVAGLLIVVGTFILGKLSISRKWLKASPQPQNSQCFQTCSGNPKRCLSLYNIITCIFIHFDFSFSIYISTVDQSIIIMQDVGAIFAHWNFLVSNQLFCSNSCRGKGVGKLDHWKLWNTCKSWCI